MRVPVRLKVAVCDGVPVASAVLLPVPLGVLPVDKDAVGVVIPVGDTEAVQELEPVGVDD